MSRQRDKKKAAKLMAREGAPPPTLSPAAPAALNLGYLNAATVIVGEFRKVQIVIAGCGGTGAYMAMHVGRLMRVLYDSTKGVNLTLVDPDLVGGENIGRQLFSQAEIGVPKAIALARRYSGAWGLNVIASVEEYSDRLLLHSETDLNIIVGCVDTTAGRRDIHNTLQRNPERVGPRVLPQYWWLDCGNLKDAGSVFLGSAYAVDQCRGIFIDPKRVISLPSPALQQPGLIIPRSEVPGPVMSCAQRQAANLQSLNINAAIAVQAADMLTRLLVTLNLKRYRSAVNLSSGSMRSGYCTPEEVAREIDRKPEFVMRAPNDGPAIDKMIIANHVRETMTRQLHAPDCAAPDVEVHL